MAKRKKFYFVDDDPDMIGFVTDHLEAAGHKVTSNNDSAKALSEILSAKPDCVLLDMMMPGIDGLEICKTLRDKKNMDATKIIMVSGKAYEFDRKRAFEFGADGYIMKPLKEKTFVAEVERILEDKVILSFWGVHGTLPVPGEKTTRYGGNTSCVTLDFLRDQYFIFDAGSGIKRLSDWLLANKRAQIEAKIFISHPHWDHINALPFFVPLYMSGNEFEIFGASHGNTTTRELVSAQMNPPYFPITLKQFGARVYFRDLGEEEFTIDENISIKTKLLSHPGQCLGYRVEYKGRSICYVTDNEMFLESDEDYYNPFYVKNLIQFVHGADALITDCTYTDEEYTSKVGWGHSCISQVVDLAHRAEVKTLYMFHHDPDHTDDRIDAKLETATKMFKNKKSKTKVLAPAEGQTYEI